MENTPVCTADKQPVAASANNSAVPAKNAGHRPGELPGNKPSPTEQNLRPILEIKDITKEFEAFTAVNKVNLTLYEGEIFALLGSSGCGKSTLLRMLAGFETPTSGSILLDGEELIGVPPYKRPVNMMFQSYALFPYMTVKQNIAFGLKQEHLPKSQIEERVEKMLHLVHMEDYVDRKPFQLSGGQRQRVALARSLAKEPRVLLLDEPMGALDKKLREQMRLELVDIINSVGVTCLMVTHDQEEAMTMADRIAIMDRGQFVQIGGPREIYENPNCRFCAEFIGSVNLFDCTLISSNATQSLLRADDFTHLIELQHDIDLADGMPLTIALRPEKIYISHEKPEEETNWCHGVVENIAYLGDISIYYVKLKDGRIVTSTLPNVDRFKQGLPTWDDQVYLSWDAESCIALTI
ncbi:polyamine ABC transporter ATP-binding protein [Succinatimonas hippei]|uniref:Spermidine/putrescine import ATP-binding protein PotA n=1 Tax=Succinatimonas hippei (strain DSM 22608 / JCM 16073 / KCTC 15190 / YIT 12066) TaxID=762983 RepID=E8LLW7_SUCHY|nr:polyamine ABC transporter ATP-binding protein [Succinatimonas hippei]EFY06480.1 polyamine ABC transporter, ATP-binding protein [Succinatimonas hippei YIT 12066]MCL1603116.1 polyamine ABC transporter ATP-binding protein [Succinatimonas hippei]MDM8120453.1 polyamine ABC transporter ATP-binding protein [Succinatimonas hippei]